MVCAYLTQFAEKSCFPSVCGDILKTQVKRERRFRLDETNHALAVFAAQFKKRRGVQAGAIRYEVDSFIGHCSLRFDRIRQRRLHTLSRTRRLIFPFSFVVFCTVLGRP